MATANLAAEIKAAEGQIVNSKLVLESTGGIFNALAASATSISVSLDRHWPYLWLPGAS